MAVGLICSSMSRNPRLTLRTRWAAFSTLVALLGSVHRARRKVFGEAVAFPNLAAPRAARPLSPTIARLLVVLCVSGCATSPRTVTRHELESESQRLQPLSSYHRDCLGSDELYHYVRIGIATGSHDCRVLKKELPIRDTYPYVPDKPRVEALLPRLTEATPR